MTSQLKEQRSPFMQTLGLLKVRSLCLVLEMEE